MWQTESFDPKRIDTELGWAESLGMNTMRVFLHNLPWQQDGSRSAFAPGLCTHPELYTPGPGSRCLPRLSIRVWKPT